MRQKQRVFSLFLLSPSSRRAWIEIQAACHMLNVGRVALLAEGVDRNTGRGGADRHLQPSPSSRRAWIEIG